MARRITSARIFCQTVLVSAGVLLVTILILLLSNNSQGGHRRRKDRSIDLRETFLPGDVAGSSNGTNCTRRGIESFPDGVFTNEQRQHGALILNFVVSAYMCGAIAYICSDYFVPSLEILCEKLNLQSDVAGATFMAAGSSAPEFFTAFIGTFISKDDTGVGAIVGSAAFNIFVITSLCCFFAGKSVYLTWWPFFRDVVVYLISVLLMSIFVLDGRVEWWEGLILALGYVGYIVLLSFNQYLSSNAERLLSHIKRKNKKNTDESNLTNPNGKIGYGTMKNEPDEVHDIKESSSISMESGIHMPCPRERRQSSRTDPPEKSVFSSPEGTVWKIIWVFGLPVIVLLFLTIPDCRKLGWQKRLYMVTFTMSTIWLALSAFVLYWMMTVIGYTLNIPDTVMGISVLAAGTSVPDTVASILVVRDGYGDMAISNIFGSNVFEVFVCLGFLWFIAAFINGPTEIASEAMAFTTVSLLLTVAFIVFIIYLNGWQLNFKTGIFCMTVYVCFLVVAILNELGILGIVEPPTYCKGPT